MCGRLRHMVLPPGRTMCAGSARRCFGEAKHGRSEETPGRRLA
jgi:hypothetical protein